MSASAVPDVPPVRDEPAIPATMPALLAARGMVSILTPDGELLEVEPDLAFAALAGMGAPLFVHRPSLARRLQVDRLDGFDLLELFCFVLPARMATPTPRGLAAALNIPGWTEREPDATLLPILLDTLLRQAARALQTPAGAEMNAATGGLQRLGWNWAPLLRARFRTEGAADPAPDLIADAMKPWLRLPRWEETPLRTRSAARPVSGADARRRLATLLGPDAEQRAGQADFAHVVAAAFGAPPPPGRPELVIAEAGTGTGKTLGYIAAASLWAERNNAPVWISTYSRHLQRQIVAELERLYPDRLERRRRVVVRKGRENYLCLLNFEEFVEAATRHGSAAGTLIACAMLSRWAGLTEDGDIQGGDLPGWFAELFGSAILHRVADRRGECIHGACRHYTRCFVEHGLRREREADLVVANHALVMSQAAWRFREGPKSSDEDAIPLRYVFDEGHHLAEAADSAFVSELSGVEAAELRLWLRGAEASNSRRRGLRWRLAEMLDEHAEIEAALAQALSAARDLPAPGWRDRLTQWDGLALGQPIPESMENPTENFLGLLARHLAERSAVGQSSYDAGECSLHPVEGELSTAATQLRSSLDAIAQPLLVLCETIEEIAGGDGSGDDRARDRASAAARMIRRKALTQISAWKEALRDIVEGEGGRDEPSHVLIVRARPTVPGRPSASREIGLFRHWIDPTRPFAGIVATSAQGIVVTSATLRDQPDGSEGENNAPAEWVEAERRVGFGHLAVPAMRAALPSPFDYAGQARCLLVDDVDHQDPDALATAFRRLFVASGGGALGLFTAISRLRTVHRAIAEPLDRLGIPVLAQHVDAMHNATLVDVFRTEIDSCLLGTDAMRDGVDVPGRALRLVVFERVPWPRPDLLHRERRDRLAGSRTGLYDDRIARLRLRQAFGRLIRSADDRGVFVLLDRKAPRRLFGAFPSGIEPRRVKLAEAAEEIAVFLRPENAGA